MNTQILQKADEFQINVPMHTGRTYKVTGFSASKTGGKLVICSYGDEAGDNAIFTPTEINAYGSLVKMINTSHHESDTAYFARIFREKPVRSKAETLAHYTALLNESNAELEAAK